MAYLGGQRAPRGCHWETCWETFGEQAEFQKLRSRGSGSIVFDIAGGPERLRGLIGGFHGFQAPMGSVWRSAGTTFENLLVFWGKKEKEAEQAKKKRLEAIPPEVRIEQFIDSRIEKAMEEEEDDQEMQLQNETEKNQSSSPKLRGRKSSRKRKGKRSLRKQGGC